MVTEPIVVACRRHIVSFLPRGVQLQLQQLFAGSITTVLKLEERLALMEHNTIPQWMPDIPTLFAAWPDNPLARPTAPEHALAEAASPSNRKHWSARAFDEYEKENRAALKGGLSDLKGVPLKRAIQKKAWPLFAACPQEEKVRLMQVVADRMPVSTLAPPQPPTGMKRGRPTKSTLEEAQLGRAFKKAAVEVFAETPKKCTRGPMMHLRVFNTKVVQECETPKKLRREMGAAVLRRVKSSKVQDAVATGHWKDHKGFRQSPGKEIGALVALLGKHMSPAGAQSKKVLRTVCLFSYSWGCFPGMRFP